MFVFGKFCISENIHICILLQIYLRIYSYLYSVENKKPNIFIFTQELNICPTLEQRIHYSITALVGPWLSPVRSVQARVIF